MIKKTARNRKRTCINFQKFTGIAILCIACLIVWVSQPALALEGFNPKLVEKFLEIQKSQSDPTFGLPPAQFQENFQTLVKQVFLFRMVTSVDPQQLPDTFPTALPGALDPLIRQRDSESQKLLWPYFFSGVLPAFGYLSGPITLVGFYNPIVDSWVLTDWAWTFEGPQQLLGIRILPGEALRGEPPSEKNRIPWTQAKTKGMITVLQEYTTQSLESFRNRYPLNSAEHTGFGPTPPPDSIGQVLVEGRLAVMLASLVPLMDSELQESTQTLLSVLRSGEYSQLYQLTNGTSSSPLRRIAGLPSIIRNYIEPTCLLATQTGFLMVLGLPYSGRWVLLAEFLSDQESQAPQLERLDVFDLVPQE